MHAGFLGFQTRFVLPEQVVAHSSSSRSLSRCIRRLTSGETTITATPRPIVIQPILLYIASVPALVISPLSPPIAWPILPATKLPPAVAKNQAPMIRLAMWRGASRFIADSPDRRQAQLAGGLEQIDAGR